MSDQFLLENLLQESFHSLPWKDRQFEDAQWLYINDLNNQDYSSGIVRFDNQTTLNQWCDMYNAYAQIPMKCVSSGTAYDVNSQVGFKSSALSLISQVQVNGNDKTVINSQGSVQMINNLRALIEHNNDWAKSQGKQIHFAKDKNARTNAMDPYKFVPATIAVGGLTGTFGLAGATGSVGSGSASVLYLPNTTFNEGALERSSLFKGDYNWENNLGNVPLSGSTSITTGALNFNSSDSSFTFDVRIPLRYLHDWFKCLDFPVINLRMLMNFTLAFSPTNPYPCNFVGFNTSTGASLPNATLSINTSSTIGRCRIYYRKLTFTPAVAKIVSSMIQSGITKKFTYLESDFYNPTNGSSETSINDVITPATQRPVRVWQILFPAGGIRSQASYSPMVTINQGKRTFTSANLLVNGMPYYNNYLMTVEEQWQIIKEQMTNPDDYSSLLSYSDYLHSYRGIICFDLSRLKDRLINPDQPCMLQAQTVRSKDNDAAPIESADIVYLVEREVDCSLTMSTGGLALSVATRL